MGKPKILLTLLFVVLVQFSFGQTKTYHPFPDSNAVWIIAQDDGFGGVDYLKYYTHTFKDDTLIDSCLYTKIYRCNIYNIYNGSYEGAYRSDTTGKTYYIPADSTQEYLLRDFSKNPGDTIKNVYFGSSYYTGDSHIIDFYVDSVNYVTAGPYLLKRMYLNNHYVLDSVYHDNYEPRPMVWIEKIGCTDGGFYNNVTILLGGRWLYCMSYNDTIYYANDAEFFYEGLPIYTHGQCIIPDGLNEINQIDSEIIITPNPFSNYITIQNINNDNPYEFRIFNAIGQLIYHKEYVLNNSNTIKLNLQNLNPGIYFFIINDKNKIIRTEKLIKIKSNKL